MVIDSEFTFSKHIENLCRMTNQKLHGLGRVDNFMTLENRRLVMKTFVFSQFNYCPLVWMCHSRKLNNKLNIQYYKKELYAMIYSEFSTTVLVDCAKRFHLTNNFCGTNRIKY